MTAPVPRRPWLRAEKRCARALAECRFRPATFDKRFAREIAADLDAYEAVPDDAPREGRLLGISEGQSDLLLRLVVKYRRQIDERIVEAARGLQAEREAQKAQAEKARTAAYLEIADDLEARRLTLSAGGIREALLGDPTASGNRQIAEIQREAFRRQLGLPLEKDR